MEFLNNDTKEHERYERAVRHVKKNKRFLLSFISIFIG
jgi:hypothetical protein